VSHVWFDDLSGATLLSVSSKRHGNFVAWIDADDAEKVAAHTWRVKMDGRVYFKTDIQQPDGKRTTLLLHRFLKSCPDGLQVDHTNHEYLDLRKNELRCVNDSQNSQNARKQNRTTSSQYKGVSWFKRDSKWRASITHNNKLIHLGLYPPTPEGEIEAATAYNKAAIELFGEFSKLNVIQERAA
jgi:hypothetical protein